MLCINDHHTDPYFNLAAEEYVLKNFSENFFMLWRNEPSVIVGRHQNSLAEINVDFVRENNIKVVRRLTGGGAVFHDLGNINFTFIESVRGENLIDFQKYTKPIIEVLQQLGVDARFEGRNDLTIEGRKFSGNSEHVYRNRVLHHGTLLYDSVLTDLSGALKANPAKFNDKAVKSVRSRVTNISEHLPKALELEKFRDLVFSHVLENYPDSEAYDYTEQDIAGINRLRDEKYSRWEWNFGQSPNYNMIKSIRSGGGHIEVHLDVQNGFINQVRIFGDFFNIGDIGDIELLLANTPHKEADIRKKLDQIALSDYLVNVTPDELINLIAPTPDLP